MSDTTIMPEIPTPETPMSEVPTPETPTIPEAADQAFAALGLGPESLRAIGDLGFTTPTPIQMQTIPMLLAGRDVIGQAPTGTGKTAAYGLPLVERLDSAIRAPQALIIVPTRELCLQVADALQAFSRYRRLLVVPIYGGQSYDRQFRALERGTQIIVGTPGRLLDHLKRGTLKLDQVREVVLDEADEMLDMGFIEDIEAILGDLPPTRQSALFSATLPPRIVGLADRFLRRPAQVRVDAAKDVAPLVRQIYYEVPGMAKVDALVKILAMEEPTSAIIFVGTRRETDEVAERLNLLGYPAQAIHGEVSQNQRERVMQSFRSGKTTLLVATDVAARGLDIPAVSHIINYDLPLESESYIHRIGRTGRAGREGEALTLITPREIRRLHFLERATHRKLERKRLPTAAEIAAKRRAAFRREVLEVLEAGELDPFMDLVRDLAGSRDPAEVAAAAFKLAAQARDARQPSGVGDIWNQPEPAPEPELPATTDRDADGAPRPPRRERGRRGDLVAPARLMVRLGRRDGLRPSDIVGAIVNEAAVAPDQIGDIDIYESFAFVDLPEELLESVRDTLSRTTLRGQNPRPVKVDPSAAPPVEERRGPRREGRPPFPRESFAPRTTFARSGHDDADRPSFPRPPRDGGDPAIFPRAPRPTFARSEVPPDGELPRRFVARDAQVDREGDVARDPQRISSQGKREKGGYGRSSNVPHGSRAGTFSKSGIHKAPSAPKRKPRREE